MRSHEFHLPWSSPDKLKKNIISKVHLELSQKLPLQKIRLESASLTQEEKCLFQTIHLGGNYFAVLKRQNLYMKEDIAGISNRDDRSENENLIILSGK